MYDEKILLHAFTFLPVNIQCLFVYWDTLLASELTLKKSAFYAVFTITFYDNKAKIDFLNKQIL